MTDCPHTDFSARVDVQRLTDDAGRVRNFVAEIALTCSSCGSPFHFVGDLTAGFSFTRPTVNVGATTLHAPIAPGLGPVLANMLFEMPPKDHS